MPTLRPLIALLATGLAATLPAAAGTHCTAYQADANADGRIDRTEWADYRDITYDDWDIDGDGMIDESEFSNCWAASGADHDHDLYNEWDVDGDSRIGGDEFFADDSYDGYDANQDGYLEGDEIFDVLL